MRQQCLTRGRQDDPARASLKQRRPKLFLERLNALGQRRLGNRYLARCRAQAAELRDGDEISKLMRFQNVINPSDQVSINPIFLVITKPVNREHNKRARRPVKGPSATRMNKCAVPQGVAGSRSAYDIRAGFGESREVGVCPVGQRLFGCDGRRRRDECRTLQ